MAWRLVTVTLLIAIVGGATAQACVDYCSLTPDNRTLCPEETASEVPPNRVYTSERVLALRNAMVNDLYVAVDLHAYLVFESSYYGGGVTDYDRRIQYISGFSGSSGSVIVTTDSAALWTDGRYFLQGDQELDCGWTLMKDGQPNYPSMTEWLVDVLPVDGLVGVDPSKIDSQTWATFSEAFAASGKNIQLVKVVPDLFDYIWTEGRPEKPNELIYEHTMDFAGLSWQAKLSNIQTMVADQQVLIVTLLDDIAWLFNLRGSDRATSPLFDSMAFVFKDSVKLFINNVTKLLPDVQDHLNTGADGKCTEAECVEVLELATVLDAVRHFENDTTITSVWINPDVGYDLYTAVPAAKRTEDYSPIQLIKSQKNDIERQNYLNCQYRDSATLIRFLTILERGVKAGEYYNEMTASDMLDAMRAEDPNYKMLSFDTISGYGTNGAVIHYRANNATVLQITTSDLYLLDSGGNYLDGTTDVTRTFHFGDPDDDEMEAYTRVLLAVIDLATTVWPEGWKGSDIDARTRTPIWQNGWDFNHGTGHGIGFFLNVHEGPGRISVSSRRSPSEAALMPGMMFSDGPGRINIGYNPAHEPLYPTQFYSDEPGFYLDNHFGVRLETIVEVVVADVPNHFNDKRYLTFEPYTLVPFEKHLIKYEMLENHHRVWLNTYHARCLEEIGGMLQNSDPEAYAWIVARTEPIPILVEPTSGARGVNSSSAAILAIAAALSSLLR